MAVFFLLIVLVVIGPLAMLYGTDSRKNEPSRPWV
jgi:hypothetical protein